MSSPSSKPNHPTATATRAALDKIGIIRDRYKRSRLPGNQAIRYDGGDFETDIHGFLSTWFPYCVLPGIRLFNPSGRANGELGIEIDDLFHLRWGDTDFVVLIEAKCQPVNVVGGEWLVSYGQKTKCAWKQVEEHITTLWEYLEPVSRNVRLQFIAIVVSPDPATKAEHRRGFRNSELALLSTDKLHEFISERFNFGLSEGQAPPELYRVSQSPLLDLLRLSLPIPALGHPELASAIRYVNRCRRTLDQSLVEDFKPKPERWLINGSAGMGKSVLLAYAAVALSSGRELYRFQGQVGVRELPETLYEEIQFDPASGPIAMLAMSAKQLDNLRGWFNFFVSLFEKADLSGDLHFRRPEFMLARNISELSAFKRTFSAVFLDEAHDLPDHAARTLKELHERHRFYFVVACDRHQQLRLSGPDARVIKGFDFSNKWIRLNQIYRNPTPVYIASLALMFRWFGDRGPKVIPEDAELKSSFGFDVLRVSKNQVTLTMKNDAHPANSWSHAVAAFPDVATAAATLRRERLERDEVLWVRFSEENSDFDYESLQRDFTYHNCRSREAYKLSDKYIKGQEFPVVVIEGFPSFMEKFGNDEEESRMWQFRRELYLCASRATCFLYLVCDVKETDEVGKIRSEIGRLLDAVGTPHSAADANGSKPWTFRIPTADKVRAHDVFIDTREYTSDEEEPPDSPAVPVADEVKTPEMESPPTLEPEPVPAPPTEVESRQEEATEEEWDLTIPEPLTAKEFADLIGTEVFRVTQAAGDLGIFPGINEPIDLNTLAGIAPRFHCKVFAEDGTEVVYSKPGKPHEDELPPEPSPRMGDQKPNEFSSGGSPASDVGGPVGHEGSETFELRKGIFVRRGDWIHDTKLGLGKVLRLGIHPELEDTHEVWFERLATVVRNHSMRGRTTSIRDEAIIQSEIRDRAPKLP